jgi:hypothetical protein
MKKHLYFVCVEYSSPSGNIKGLIFSFTEYWTRQELSGDLFGLVRTVLDRNLGEYSVFDIVQISKL